MSHQPGQTTTLQRPMGQEAAQSPAARAQQQQGNSALAGALLRRKIQRRLLRRSNDEGVAANAESAITSAAASSSGAPLPAPIQRKFEASLGTDLSQVRVHTGSASAAAAASVGAHAYATGSDIHFGSGQYDPSSPAGEKLLAHEVAHTAQQSDGPRFKLDVSDPGDSSEVEADTAAEAMVQGAPTTVGGGSGVARQVMRSTPAAGTAPAPAAAGGDGGVAPAATGGATTAGGTTQDPATATGGGAAPAATGGTVTGTFLVNNGVQLFIHAAPGTNTPRLAKLAGGAVGEILFPQLGQWLMVRQGGVVGYITAASRYVGVMPLGGVAGLKQRQWDGIPAPQAVAQVDAETDVRLWAESCGLAEAMDKKSLAPEEIAKVRKLIEPTPEPYRTEYFLKLQEKSEYRTQRDNANPIEDNGGGTCNVTALAMCLEYLGIPNPHPEMQYEDALNKVRLDNNFGNILYAGTWQKIAQKLGATCFTLMITDTSQAVPRAMWEGEVQQHLAQGHSVLCSIVGHIVRIQAVKPEGVVVDDPYGKSVLLAGDGHSWDGKNQRAGTKDKDSAANAGEDRGWPWADVEQHTFRCLLAFAV